ncbi:MAG: thioredoxin family protein [Planctomycetaceae bacterium]|nr:thioredoxin family protein [Planctomycetaceae bacterium]
MVTKIRFFLAAAVLLIISILLFFPHESNLQSNSTHESKILNDTKDDNKPLFLYDFNTALATAKAESKPLVVLFTIPNNDSCKRSLELFNDNEIKRLSKRFVCVSIDAAASASICELHRVNGFPTILILNSDGMEIQRLTGKEPLEQLAIQMHIAIQLSTRNKNTKQHYTEVGIGNKPKPH